MASGLARGCRVGTTLLGRRAIGHGTAWLGAFSVVPRPRGGHGDLIRHGTDRSSGLLVPSPRFNGGTGHCDTGDCAGALSCTVSGQPPATLAEYTIGGTGNNQDYYDISVVDGYNLAMAFSCSTVVGLVCTDRSCPDAYQYPTDDTKTHSCSGNSNYQVTFCP
ncbi:thaumatin-like pathogenesis-related protein 2 [Miscanthus floridulus]|uniref:thaumatin-like pathogenesis-related protein 2 n=1 Tax=Miscanthus floridulus TaxID=154761 RepID=UPI0034587D6A